MLRQRRIRWVPDHGVDRRITSTRRVHGDVHFLLVRVADGVFTNDHDGDGRTHFGAGGYGTDHGDDIHGSNIATIRGRSIQGPGNGRPVISDIQPALGIVVVRRFGRTRRVRTYCRILLRCRHFLHRYNRRKISRCFTTTIISV